MTCLEQRKSARPGKTNLPTTSARPNTPVFGVVDSSIHHRRGNGVPCSRRLPRARRGRPHGPPGDRVVGSPLETAGASGAGRCEEGRSPRIMMHGCSSSASFKLPLIVAMRSSREGLNFACLRAISIPLLYSKGAFTVQAQYTSRIMLRRGPDSGYAATRCRRLW
jgi:hypothetical protein